MGDVFLSPLSLRIDPWHKPSSLLAECLSPETGQNSVLVWKFVVGVGRLPASGSVLLGFLNPSQRPKGLVETGLASALK